MKNSALKSFSFEFVDFPHHVTNRHATHDSNLHSTRCLCEKKWDSLRNFFPFHSRAQSYEWMNFIFWWVSDLTCRLTNELKSSLGDYSIGSVHNLIYIYGNSINYQLFRKLFDWRLVHKMWQLGNSLHPRYVRRLYSNYGGTAHQLSQNTANVHSINKFVHLQLCGRRMLGIV